MIDVGVELPIRMEHVSTLAEDQTLPTPISLILSSEIGKRSRESGHGRDGGHR
jgi:hypothetical protein